MKELFHRYYASLCYYSYRLTGERETAEDIVQHVFTRYWESCNKEPIGNSKAWLYRAVHNAALNEMEKQQTYLRMKEQVNHLQEEVEKDAGMLLIESETARQLWGRVNELSPQCRKIIRLYFIEGLSNMEIAERLRLHVSTIKTQKQRGIAYLRRVMLPIITAVCFFMQG